MDVQIIHAEPINYIVPTMPRRPKKAKNAAPVLVVAGEGTHIQFPVPGQHHNPIQI